MNDKLSMKCTSLGAFVIISAYIETLSLYLESKIAHSTDERHFYSHFLFCWLKLRANWGKMWWFHLVKITSIYSPVWKVNISDRNTSQHDLWNDKLWELSEAACDLLSSFLFVAMNAIILGDCTTLWNDCFDLFFKLLKQPTVCFHFPDMRPLAVMIILLSWGRWQ